MRDGANRPGADRGPAQVPGRTVVIRARPVPELVPTDVLLGLGAGAVQLAWRASTPLRALARAVVVTASAMAPPAITSALADRGRVARATLEVALRRVLEYTVPRVVGSVLVALDLNTLIEQHVDLDRVAGELDVAAVIDRVDLDDVVRRVDIEAVIDRVDLDAVVARVDIDAVVARVDIDAVLDRVDLDAVAGRIDLDAVASKLDLDRLVQRVDIEAVLARLDLAGIAESVITEIDLPEILRQSSGTLASEAIRGVRTGSMQADDAVGRVVDRLLRRRSGPIAPTVP